MRSNRSRPAAILVLGALLSACGSSASPSPAALVSQVPSIAPATPVASPASTPSATTPAATPTAAASSTPSIPSAALPVQGSARELSSSNVQLAPSRGGGVYVAIPVREGPSVLVLLDAAGHPRPGWPIALEGTKACERPLPVADGSVRIVCDGTQAFSFDASGQLIDGWPVQVAQESTTGLGGDSLTNVFERYASGTHDAVVTAFSATGTATSSQPIRLFKRCCNGNWAIGPDGVAYGVGRQNEGVNRTSVTGLDVSGVVSEWNVEVAGVGSSPTFAADNEVIVAFGSDVRRATRIVVGSRAEGATVSAAIPLRTAESSGDTGGCTVGEPNAPVWASNGTTFVYSELESSIFALDASMAVRTGWPFEPATPLTIPRPGLETEHEAGYCPLSLTPAAGPDGTLVLSVAAANSRVGGSLVAVGRNGRIRPGWPVGLKRPGSEFWAVAVGEDGTTYALAIEPESGGKSSGTVLAIAPDSTVLWSTTVVNP